MAIITIHKDIKSPYKPTEEEVNEEFINQCERRRSKRSASDAGVGAGIVSPRKRTRLSGSYREPSSDSDESED